MARESGPGARFGGHVYPQQLPVVPEVRPGDPAPWADLAPDARRGLDLATVVGRLRASGRSGDPPESPSELSGEPTGPDWAVTRRSAVLVALFEDDGETQVVLTRRSLALRHHRGEIAFPGGRADAGESLLAAALREAHEEVGLDSGAVTPVGWLHPLVSFVSASAIWPMVATLDRRPDLVPDPTEVDRAFAVTLSDLVADGTFVEERWRREGRPGGDDEGFVPINFYLVPDDLIWGATARVLTELLCVALGVAWTGGLVV
jgi:8-oxo-dGTP pyrophosphatase MutT (NUDIX family)